MALGQVVDLAESERRLMTAALRDARETRGVGDPAASQLRAVGPVPYEKLEDRDRAAGLIRSRSLRGEDFAPGIAGADFTILFGVRSFPGQRGIPLFAPDP